ncbi:hypothetical protein RQCS_40440 [Rhodococcus qingshengii]|uniref:hypothetical protein n=1 Tax=Rhodococcus qingshengii TaxID=334542 RepID=UPI0007E5A2F6|nr:hypothetical protein [Rhodococcus qingshengii]BCF84499.1 hypothetical protein RQCS_40440 [Rhodococcus qingshengii]
MKVVVGFVAALIALVLIKNVFLAIAGNWLTILLVFATIIAIVFIGTFAKTFIDINREGRKLAKQQRAELLARAINQNTAYLQGHERGVYGDYPPEKLD